MPDHTCATCRRYTATDDATGTCSRYDCTTPAAFCEDWGYCWEEREDDTTACRGDSEVAGD